MAEVGPSTQTFKVGDQHVAVTASDHTVRVHLTGAVKSDKEFSVYVNGDRHIGKLSNGEGRAVVSSSERVERVEVKNNGKALFILDR